MYARADGSRVHRRALPPRPRALPPNTWNKPRVQHKGATSPLPFGAWYLPSESWGKPAPPHDGEAAAAIAHVRDPSALHSPADTAADAAAESIAAKLMTLYSSQRYRNYLKERGARVPGYLLAVESPRAGQRRGSGVSLGGSGALSAVQLGPRRVIAASDAERSERKRADSDGLAAGSAVGVGSKGQGR